MKPIFIHSITTLNEPKFIKPASLVTYTRGDKLSKKLFWETRVNPFNTVHILVNNLDTKSLILVQQVRIPTHINGTAIGGLCYEVCAGLVDSDMSVDAIARAEVREELGYTVDYNSIVALPTYLSSVGTSGSICHPFYCEVTNADFTGQDLGPDEDIEPYSLSYDYIPEFLRTATNTDSSTRYLLQWFLLNKSK